MSPWRIETEEDETEDSGGMGTAEDGQRGVWATRRRDREEDENRVR